MFRRSRGRWALLAALLLLVQSFGTAYASGTGPVPVALDAFGNPLCITSYEHDALAGGDHNGSLTDCCALACASLAGLLATPGASDALAPDARLLARLAGTASVAPHPAVDLTVGNPRAPPLAMGTIGRPGHLSHRSAA